MQAHSQVIAVQNQGLVLDVTSGELNFTAYVVVSDADLDRVADIVPRDHYDRYESLHVAAVTTAHDAPEQVTEITFNMNPGDAVVFLCHDESAYAAALHELGQQSASSRPS